jgi:2-hydroxy-3-keto-5-methylthiopentenyl-1-phosphate phosphatase
MSSNVAVRGLVVDFDGTICPQDVSEEILNAFAGPGWWQIDLEFRRGEIGSRECLVRQAELLRGERDAMLGFALANYSIQPSFGPFAAWAASKGMEVAVASDGLGFYIEPMLRAAEVGELTILTNEFEKDGATPRLAFPAAHGECVGCGTCKMLAVRRMRERLGPVAFIGEGHSDRFGALYADLVFAKKHLIDICRADGVPFLTWDTFDDIRDRLETLTPGDVGTPVAPERCPGWTPAPTSTAGGGTGI